MDIDDILRDVDAGHDAPSQQQRDLQALTRAWVAERSCPEVLEYVEKCPPLLWGDLSIGVQSTRPGVPQSRASMIDTSVPL